MKILYVISVALPVFILTGCSDSSGPTMGILSGKVTDAVTLFSISNVQVLVFDANTNAPVGPSEKTRIDGRYSVQLSPGSYYAIFSRLGYFDVPPKGISPIPLSVREGRTTEYFVIMIPSDVPGVGAVTGRVTLSGAGFGGVLVTAGDTSNGYSSVTDGEGYFTINNIPAGFCIVEAWHSGYQSSDTTVLVTAGTSTSDVRIEMTAGEGGMVKGRITFLAAANAEVDVALVHAVTRQTIPGLTAMTVSQEYEIPYVPAGKYLARAAFKNDNIVVDPDWIVKNGEPFVTVDRDTVTMDFSVTGAVELLSPTNPLTSAQPVVVADSLPVFSWTPYSSAEDYAVEVINQTGSVIWGGFASDWSVRKVVTTETQIRFNSDTTATEPLKSGMIYRWKIYAGKVDHREPYGWKLISVSEDQMGIIKFVR